MIPRVEGPSAVQGGAYSLRRAIGKSRGRHSRGAEHPCELIATIGSEAQELPFHRVDPGDIGRNEMIAAALARYHLKVTARVGGGRTRAAEMDKGRQILRLLRVWLRIARQRENISYMP